MSPERDPSTTAWVALILLPVGVMLAVLQSEMTFREPLAGAILADYVAGHSNYTIDSRPLMRWLILATTHLSPLTRDPAAANALLQGLFAWAGLVASFAFARAFLAPGWAFGAALLVAAQVPWGFTQLGYNLSYPYDFSALALSATGLALALRGRLWLFAPLLAVATLNKETAAWLVLAWPLAQVGSRPWKRLALETLLLVAIFGAAYFAPRLILRPYPTVSPVTASFSVPADETLREWHARWRDNVAELAFQNRSGFPLSVHLALWPHVVALFALPWLPRTLRRLYAAALFFFVAMFFAGNIWEVRIFNELLPLGAVAVVGLVADGLPRAMGPPLDQGAGRSCA